MEDLREHKKENSGSPPEVPVDNAARCRPGQPHQRQEQFAELTHATPEARWASHDVAAKWGILTTDELRSIEGWGPLPGRHYHGCRRGAGRLGSP